MDNGPSCWFADRATFHVRRRHAGTNSNVTVIEQTVQSKRVGPIVDSTEVSTVLPLGTTVQVSLASTCRDSNQTSVSATHLVIRVTLRLP